jgi:steroid delta-isomerase-like uncharacterized protein
VPSIPETVARTWVDRWNEGDLDGLVDLAAADYVHHAMSGEDLDLDGFRRGLADVLASFPGIAYRVQHAAADGDLVALALVAEGTHAGDFLGVAPTGATVTFRGMYHCRVHEGRVAEDWDVFDLLVPLLRLGATIAPPAAG